MNLSRRKLPDQPVLYVLFSGTPVCGHWHRVEFLTEDEAAAHGQRYRKRRDEKLISLNHPSLKSKYWVDDHWEVLSTAQIMQRFKGGKPVGCRTGPHDTASDASDCVNAAWESPGD